MAKKNFVNLILISSNWELNHRERLHNALNDTLGKWSEIQFVEYPFSIFIHTLIKFRSRFFPLLKYGRKREINNKKIFTPIIFFHDKIWKRVNFTFKLDSFLIRWQLNRFINSKFSKSSIILWCYHPHNYLVIKSVKRNYIVYDYYDNYAYNNDGTLNKLLDELNEKTVMQANLIFCTGQIMFNYAKKINSDTYYVPNGHDFNLNEMQKIKKFDFRLKGNIIGYIGNIRDWIDFNLIQDLLDSLPENNNLVFVGPVERNVKGKIELLKLNKKFKHYNKVPYHKIPGYIKGFNIAIIPFKLNKFTEGVLPNKFFEYLVCETKIVSTNLPDLKYYSELVNIADSNKKFIEYCISPNTLINPVMSANYQTAVEDSTWNSRGITMNNILLNLLNNSGSSENHNRNNKSI